MRAVSLLPQPLQEALKSKGLAVEGSLVRTPARWSFLRATRHVRVRMCLAVLVLVFILVQVLLVALAVLDALLV